MKEIVQIEFLDIEENDEYKVFNEANQPVFANIQNVSAVVRKRCF